MRVARNRFSGAVRHDGDLAVAPAVHVIRTRRGLDVDREGPFRLIRAEGGIDGHGCRPVALSRRHDHRVQRRRAAFDDNCRVGDRVVVAADCREFDRLLLGAHDVRFGFHVEFCHRERFDAGDHVQHDRKRRDAHDKRDNESDRKSFDTPLVRDQSFEPRHASRWPDVGT